MDSSVALAPLHHVVVEAVALRRRPHAVAVATAVPLSCFTPVPKLEAPIMFVPVTVTVSVTVTVTVSVSVSVTDWKLSLKNQFAWKYFPFGLPGGAALVAHIAAREVVVVALAADPVAALGVEALFLRLLGVTLIADG